MLKPCIKLIQACDQYGTIRLWIMTLRVAMKMIRRLKVSMIPVNKTCIHNYPNAAMQFM